MNIRFLLITVTFSTLLIPVSWAEGLPTVKPKNVGLSPERLQRIETLVQDQIDKGNLTGAVTLVARRGGEAHLRAYGMADQDDAKPMTTDTIFRIASMSKPITSVAVMMLYEEGKFLLNDPVGKYLSELNSLEVLEETENGSGTFRRVPSERPVTIRDLLTHTSGITYKFLAEPVFAPNNKQLYLSSIYRDSEIPDGLVEYSGKIEDLVTLLGEQPLLHQPGTVFSYGLNTDVLGRLIEVVSGMPLDEFLRTRIFEPLEMEDTYFYLPRNKAGRLAALYVSEPNQGLSEVEAVVENKYLPYSATFSTCGQCKHFSGGAGLASTARDYSRILQMLLNGGELDGIRLLSPLTVRLMTSNHIGELPSSGPVQVGPGGFGLGFQINASPVELGEIGSEGSYSWLGIFNTMFWVDPKEQLIGIMMSQLYLPQINFHNKFRVMTYQSIVE